MIKLLVVDDSALMRRLLARLFSAEGDFDIAFARDGGEALSVLHRFQPDVLTLDVNMPHMDGLTCLDRIMVERPTPVVMLSSLTDTGADVTLEALSLGAVDFMPKPNGAISLSIDTLGPRLVHMVRVAARARVRGSLRLAERLRQGGGATPARSLSALPQRTPFAAKPRVGLKDWVVLVGASTGGPPALDALLGPLPADFPWPILVAQHMPASFTGPLARRLDRLCALSVMEVTRPVGLVPGHVYVGRGDADVVLSARNGDIVAMAAPSLPENRWHPSVDRLVLSALQLLGAPRLVGVLLTGMGDDGAAAMARVRAEGGRTLAESEESAVVWGMPGELVKAGGAELVAPAADMAGHLMAWAS